MTKPVLAALIETMASIESADESMVSLDFSVDLMEQIAYILHSLPEEDRAEFARTATELANQSDDQQRAEFIRSLPVTLGLL